MQTISRIRIKQKLLEIFKNDPVVIRCKSISLDDLISIIFDEKSVDCLNRKH